MRSSPPGSKGMHCLTASATRNIVRDSLFNSMKPYLSRRRRAASYWQMRIAYRADRFGAVETEEDVLGIAVEKWLDRTNPPHSRDFLKSCEPERLDRWVFAGRTRPPSTDCSTVAGGPTVRRRGRSHSSNSVNRSLSRIHNPLLVLLAVDRLTVSATRPGRLDRRGRS